MITLKADNRSLTKNAKFSYLNDNFLSGVSDLTLTNVNGFSTNDYVLIGEFGMETSEIKQIDSINSSTNTITLKSNTAWAHAESTRVTIIKYNQVRFYHTSDTTFSASESVTGYIDIQPDSYYTLGYDTSNTTGYGWFIFFNSHTSTGTQNSNAIPYAGFDSNMVKSILDRFYSQINNNEMKLISNEDALSWLNEGYSKLLNQLNLVNNTYNTTLEYELTTTSGVAEYSLPTAFSEILSVWGDGDDTYLDYVSPAEALKYGSTSSNTVKYYIRGNYIGFSPTPTSSDTYKITYKAKSTELTSYYDTVDVPNNQHYCLVDYMLYKASPKLNRNGSEYFALFTESIKDLKVTSHKQSGEQDSFTIDGAANI